MQDVVLDTQESFLDNLFKPNNTFTVSGKTFTVLSKLGKGTYGTVYKVQVVDEQGIISYKAAKVLTTGNNQGILSLRELDIMAKFLHPNLIHNHGLLIQSSLARTAVIILMPVAQTDLFAMMRSDTLTTFQKLNILYDIVLGLNYLHKNNYLHLDLKPMNILLFEDNKGLKAKITDFGLSLVLEKDKKYYPQELVTLTYRAPEILRGDYNYTVKSDIWSLGIIFLEVLSGGKSLFRVFTEDKVLADIQLLLSPENIDNTLNAYLYPLPENTKIQTITLLKSMLNLNPVDRPTTDQILLDPLFDIIKKDNKINKGVVIPVERAPPKECSLIYYYGYDYMIRIAASLKIRLETVFLAADIYQRSLRYGFNLTGTFAKDWPNIALLASTSLYLAIKTIDTYYSSPNYFAKLSNNMFGSQDILNMEAAIVQLFNGIIYPTNLFNVTNSKQRLLAGFELLRNCNIYYKLDLVGWSKLDSSDKYNKYIPFRQFFEETEYYKLMKTTTQEVYLPQMFNTDKSRR